MDGIKIAYRIDFPRIGKVLFIRVTTGEVATVSVTNGSTGKIISSKRLRITAGSLTILNQVVKEVTGVGTEDATELYEKLFNLYAKCENCKMPCCTR